MYSRIIQDFLRRTGYIRIHPRAALIDMDGTLYDSMPRHAEAWRRMMSEIGIDVPANEFFRYEGRTGASTIKILFRENLGRDATDQECKELYRRKTEIFSSLPEVDPMPGAREMLEFMAQISIERVLVTGSGQSTLLNRIDRDFPGAFSPDLRVTSRDVIHGKPSPEPFQRAMQKARVEPWECFVVENAPLGIEAGHAAGVFTVGVNTGPLDVDELEEAGADIVFPSMSDFAEALPVLIYCFVTTMNNFN